MARGPKTTDAAKLEPLFVINDFIYGKASRAAADSFFDPSTQAQRDELVALGCARDLTEDEQKLYAQIGAGNPVDPVPEDSGDAESETGDESENEIA